MTLVKVRYTYLDAENKRVEGEAIEVDIGVIAIVKAMEYLEQEGFSPHDFDDMDFLFKVEAKGGDA